MIHNFYIVKKNGICVFHKKFGSLEEEPQSIAGFLTAISMFSSAIIGEDIKVLATNSFKFIFKTDEQFTFVTFTDNSDGHEDIQLILENVKTNFYQKFPDSTRRSESGNLKVYETFSGDIEKIVHRFQ